MMVSCRQKKFRLQRHRETAAQGDATLAQPLTTLFSAASNPLLLIDAQQIIRGINPAAMALLGLRDTAIKGQRWRDVFYLEQELAQDGHGNPIIQCLRSGQHQALAKNTVLFCAAQRTSVSGQVLAMTLGTSAMAVLSLHVATEAGASSLSRQHEHEQLLQHMSRLNTVSELATGIAHEINQPLSAIMSFNQAALRLLSEDRPDVDCVSEALAEAVNQTRRAADILERLRAFVSRRDLQFKTVAINQVVINALALLSSQITQASVRVNLRTEPCPAVYADALQLEQVMVNLLRNAIEAMSVTGTGARCLQIATQSVAGQVHIEITDSGPGLSTSALQQLFTRFFTTKPEGMGLGLSISRTILEAAGGELSASNNVDGGACFRITLPIHSAKEVRCEPLTV
jgi:C4-dicarboxylate-specific signal transduction histidine kinase